MNQDQSKLKNTHPVTINEGFICEKCKKENPKATKSCRNHCIFCLYSKHVDDLVPGDRASTCLGLMEPLGIDYNSKKGYQIIYLCKKCKKKAKNIAADDDDMELITKIMQRQNIGFDF